MANHGPEELMEFAVHVVVATVVFVIIALAAVCIEVLAHAAKGYIDGFGYSVLISLSRCALALDALVFVTHLVRYAISVLRGK